LPLLGGGGELVGSAKLGTPWERMHLATASSCDLRLADACWPPLPPAKPAHACWAALNAGDSALIVFGIVSPPAALGSGKFGTPCARMHSASLSSGPPLAPAGLGRFDEPHAQSRHVAPTTASVAHA
jgi:hypothetical protein